MRGAVPSPDISLGRRRPVSLARAAPHGGTIRSSHPCSPHPHSGNQQQHLRKLVAARGQRVSVKSELAVPSLPRGPEHSGSPSPEPPRPND